MVDEKPVGDITYPLTLWSGTITKTKADVPLELLNVVIAWTRTFCTRGAWATEVGQKAFKFHLQGVFECRYPKTPACKKKLQKIIRSLLGARKGAGYKILIKPFAEGQTLSAMIGYVTKGIPIQ